MARPRRPEAERRTHDRRARDDRRSRRDRRAGRGGTHLGAREQVELHRIGVTLNQIARALKSGASAPDETLEAGERVGRARGRPPERPGTGRMIPKINAVWWSTPSSMP